MIAPVGYYPLRLLMPMAATTVHPVIAVYPSKTALCFASFVACQFAARALLRTVNCLTKKPKNLCALVVCSRICENKLKL